MLILDFLINCIDMGDVKTMSKAISDFRGLFASSTSTFDDQCLFHAFETLEHYVI